VIRTLNITGDVHQLGYVSKEHDALGYCRRDYLRVIDDYCGILEKYDLKCLLYVTGTALVEERGFWKGIQKRGHTLGLHTWDAFQTFHKGKGWLNNKLYGCNYGSVRAQFRDVQKCSVVKKAFKITDWRTHEYASNLETRKLLGLWGYEKVSDRFDLPTDFFPFLPRNGFVGWVDPFVVAPEDHSCIKHDLLGDERKGLWTANEYFRFFKQLVKEKKSGVLQLHPMCMRFIDDFSLFEKICQGLS